VFLQEGVTWGTVVESSLLQDTWYIFGTRYDPDADYAYIYSTDGSYGIQKSHAAIIQPGFIGSNTWEEIRVGSIARTATNSIQICTITGAKPAPAAMRSCSVQNHGHSFMHARFLR
jgi:hypothetical protein